MPYNYSQVKVEGGEECPESAEVSRGTAGRGGGLSYCLSNQAFGISRFVSRNSGQINATGQPDSARTCLNGI